MIDEKELKKLISFTRKMHALQGGSIQVEDQNKLAAACESLMEENKQAKEMLQLFKKGMGDDKYYERIGNGKIFEKLDELQSLVNELAEWCNRSDDAKEVEGLNLHCSLPEDMILLNRLLAAADRSPDASKTIDRIPDVGEKAEPVKSCETCISFKEQGDSCAFCGEDRAHWQPKELPLKDSKDDLEQTCGNCENGKNADNGIYNPTCGSCMMGDSDNWRKLE